MGFKKIIDSEKALGASHRFSVLEGINIFSFFFPKVKRAALGLLTHRPTLGRITYTSPFNTDLEHRAYQCR